MYAICFVQCTNSQQALVQGSGVIAGEDPTNHWTYKRYAQLAIMLNKDLLARVTDMSDQSNAGHQAIHAW